MKREGYSFYFIVDHEDKNMTLKDKAIQETMDEIGFPIYSTIAGPSTRDSLFMKKEFQDNDISLMNIVFEPICSNPITKA